MANYRSPGVYIVEENAFPNSAVAVETAIPAFIGYTFKAERDGKSLKRIPTKINSFAEYVESFGGAFNPNFLAEIKKKEEKQSTDNSVKEKRVQSFKLGDQDYTLSYADDNELYFFNSIRLFYANGGSSCVILSIGTYGDAAGNNGETKPKEISIADFKATEAFPESPLDLLKNVQEPTLIVIPDIIALGQDAYEIYTQVLAHCAEMQSRFGVFDLRSHKDNVKPDDVVDEFRDKIGTNFLNFGAAYYPWLNTGIVDADELNFTNLPGNLSDILEPGVKEIFDKYQNRKNELTALVESLNNSILGPDKLLANTTNAVAEAQDVVDNAIAANNVAKSAAEASPDDTEKSAELTKTTDDLKRANEVLTSAKASLESVNAAILKAKTEAEKIVVPTGATPEELKKAADDAVIEGKKQLEDNKKKLAQIKVEIINLNKNHHLALKSSSPYYRTLLNQARNLSNELPPSAAMAGLYTMVDNTRGVWKAPANYSLNSVNSPLVNISSEAQERFNIDPYTGKSINVIRAFQGLGTLVWGGRTLDGNSGDWKYINVRRTLIMIEQSIKAATRAYVFEPNDSNTWLTVKSMISNFLTNLWKQGALAGAVPEQAFDIQIGLGSTMTPTDILEGKMLITIKVAVVRPAEFIVITFQQQLQQS